jgi:hypothetical protein
LRALQTRTSFTKLPSPKQSHKTQIPSLQNSREYALKKTDSSTQRLITNSLRACLTLMGAFAIMFCSVGFINAFGVFQEYYAETLLSNKSASTISWLGSFNIFVMFGGTFFVGYLSDKYGPKAGFLFRHKHAIDRADLTPRCFFE